MAGGFDGEGCDHRVEIAGRVAAASAKGANCKAALEVCRHRPMMEGSMVDGFTITERWLADTGGWQAWKMARTIHQSAAVLASEFDGTRLRGQVRGGGRTYACGLLIKSKTDVTNLCSCPDTRRSGAVCAHSLAVGLAWIHRNAAPPAAPAPRAPAGRSSNAAASPGMPVAPVTLSGALGFVLPPNFFEGLKRGRLALSITEDRGVPADPADRPFVQWLAAQRVGKLPPSVALDDRAVIDGLLKALAGHPRVRWGNTPAFLRIGAVPLRLPLTVEADAAGANVRLHCHLGTEMNAGVAVPPGGAGTAWFLTPERRKLLPVEVPAAFVEVLRTIGSAQPLTRPLRWFAEHIDALQESFEPDAPGDLLRLRRSPGVPRFELDLDGSLDLLSGRLRVRYAGLDEPLPVLLGGVGKFPVPDPSDARRFYDRNLPAENAAVRRLERAGFEFDPAESRFILRREGPVLQFFAGELPRLEREWTVKTGARFATATAKVERVAPKWQPVASGADWLAFDVKFASDSGTQLDRASVRRLLQTNQGHRRMANGRIAVVALEEVEDFEEVLRDVQPEQGSGHYRVGKAQLDYLEGSLPGIASEAGGAVAPLTLPASLENVLRDYQKEGAAWLASQARRVGGGVLADEMGLGKTLQSLAVMEALHRADPTRPSLVVGPKSLIGNWLDEARRFVPDVPVRAVRSGERTLELAALADPGIVVTSYQLLARDLEHYRAVQWQAVFLDEASFIRNPDTQTSKAVRRLKAGARFALTGTPIENAVRDLWSIFEFAVPGYLGARDDFRDRYEAPLSAGAEPAVLRRLRRRVAPHILRRVKSEVARELPSKIEKVVPCELTDFQRELYAKLLREGTDKIRQAERSRQQASARMTMLTTLLRLRQTCCDPRLMGLEPPGGVPAAAHSGKLAALAELLEEIREGGHSVLIFSQFASMLRLLEETVRAAGLGHCRLDGATADRDGEVRAFRDDPQRRVFLISLKAGGFGLNLTKADTVIHFDPWWNPAVEAQATDRAHRIGQDRPVTVYKLASPGTVEEKILALQKRKRGLLDAALDDAEPTMDGLGESELRELLEIK